MDKNWTKKCTCENFQQKDGKTYKGGEIEGKKFKVRAVADLTTRIAGCSHD